MKLAFQISALAVLAACAAAVPSIQAQQASAPTQAAPQAPAAAMPAARTRGFLTTATTPDAFATIPPAPQEGELRNDLDWAIFRATRSMEKDNPDRWKLAQDDNSYTSASLLKDFSCSVGAALTPQNAPTLASIISRTTADAGSAAARAKDIFKRTRPYLHNTGNICIERSQSLSESYDYPSGHSSLGFTAGLVIAQIAPDRATQIIARGRAFGESRVVCGVHNYSAVEAGRTNAAGVFAALQGNAEYLAALAKAREEVDAARKSGPKPEAPWCTKEAELIKPLAVK